MYFGVGLLGFGLLFLWAVSLALKKRFNLNVATPLATVRIN